MAKKKQTIEKEALPVEEVIIETQEAVEEEVTEPVSEEVIEEEKVEEESELKDEKYVEPETQETVEEKVTEPVSEEESELKDEKYVEPEKVIEEFTNAAKDIDAFVTNTTTKEELTAKLEKELQRTESVEAQLEKQIADLEKKISPEAKQGFTKFWMGTSEGWFN